MTSSRHMPGGDAPVYFTVTCHLAPIIADLSGDSDYNPNTARIDATVTFIPKLRAGEVLHAYTASPPTGFLVMPVTAMIDDGYLKLRSKPDAGAAPLPSPLHAKLAADGVPIARQEVRINPRSVSYAPVRLLGNSDLLNLDPETPLFYDFVFSNIKIDGKATSYTITGGTFEAPWEDTVIDLIHYMPLPAGPYAAGMIQGPQGPPGEPGPATVNVGTTTTSLPGTDAQVSNAGDGVNAVFDFVIPRGDVGPQGPPGSIDNLPEGIELQANKGQASGYAPLGADSIVPAQFLPPIPSGVELQANKGVAGGYAPLDGGSKVPAANLPSYVDDVVEAANLAAFPATGETGKIYVALDSGMTYRWSGTTYIAISDKVTSTGITDSTVVGRKVITAVDEEAARDAIGAVNEAAVKTLINLNAGYKAPAIDVLGDSITAQCGGYRPVSPPSGTVYPAAAYHTARGYLFYALTLLSNRVRPGVNFGIGGQTTAQMKARLVDVLASPSPYVHVYAGINDLMQGFSTQTTKSNLLSIYTQLLEAGKTVTTATIGTALPISGAAVLAAAPVGATTFSTTVGADANDVLVLGAAGNTETVTVASAASTGTDKWTITLKAPTTKAHDVAAPFTNTTRIARLHDLNQWIVDYCQGRYADPVSGTMVVNSGKAPHLVDWHSLLADPANGKPFGALQPSGAITTVTVDPDTLVVDGTHPGQDLAHRMGQSLAVVLDRLVPPLPVQLGDNSDTSNLILNGRCVGTTAQGLATGFAIGSESGVGTVTATASKVPRTDGVPGEMQQVQIGPGNVTPFQLFVCDQRDMTFTGNDYFVAEVEFETDQNLVVTGAAGVPFCVRVYTRNGSALLDSARSPDFASAADGAGTMWPSRGVIKTLPLKVSATANRLQVMVLTQNVAAGTYRIKSARFRKVVMSPTVTTPGEATPVADDPAAVDPVEADAPANKTK